MHLTVEKMWFIRGGKLVNSKYVTCLVSSFHDTARAFLEEMWSLMTGQILLINRSSATKLDQYVKSVAWAAIYGIKNYNFT